MSSSIKVNQAIVESQIARLESLAKFQVKPITSTADIKGQTATNLNQIAKMMQQTGETLHVLIEDTAVTLRQRLNAFLAVDAALGAVIAGIAAGEGGAATTQGHGSLISDLGQIASKIQMHVSQAYQLGKIRVSEVVGKVKNFVIGTASSLYKKSVKVVESIRNIGKTALQKISNASQKIVSSVISKALPKIISLGESMRELLKKTVNVAAYVGKATGVLVSGCISSVLGCVNQITQKIINYIKALRSIEPDIGVLETIRKILGISSAICIGPAVAKIVHIVIEKVKDLIRGKSDSTVGENTNDDSHVVSEPEETPDEPDVRISQQKEQMDGIDGIVQSYSGPCWYVSKANLLNRRVFADTGSTDNFLTKADTENGFNNKNLMDWNYNPYAGKAGFENYRFVTTQISGDKVATINGYLDPNSDHYKSEGILLFGNYPTSNGMGTHALTVTDYEVRPDGSIQYYVMDSACGGEYKRCPIEECQTFKNYQKYVGQDVTAETMLNGFQTLEYIQ